MSAEYPAAQWIPIPGFGYDPAGSHGREGHAARWIIVHKTASPNATAQQIASYFQGDNQNGTHFVIGRDGSVIQMVALGDAAYGNAPVNPAKHDAFWDTLNGLNPNFVTCSIEHCTTTIDNSDPLTPAQQDASLKLIAWLCKTLNIPARPADANGGICGHNSIDGINRALCPNNYPWDALWSYLDSPVALSFGGKESNGMLIQHPTHQGRVDLLYVGTDANGDLWHNWNDESSFASLAHPRTENWGKPAGVNLIPWTAGGCWSADGNTLQAAVAAEPNGQIYLKAVDYYGKIVVDWTPVAGQSVKTS